MAESILVKRQSPAPPLQSGAYGAVERPEELANGQLAVGSASPRFLILSLQNFLVPQEGASIARLQQPR